MRTKRDPPQAAKRLTMSADLDREILCEQKQGQSFKLILIYFNA